MDKEFEKLFYSLKKLAEKEKDGFTVFLPSLEYVFEGWVIGMSQTANCYGDEGLQKALMTALNSSKVLGFWFHEGRFVWDACIVVYDKKTAEKIGKANNQIAIYEIKTGLVSFI